jgi:hypothetical protein
MILKMMQQLLNLKKLSRRSQLMLIKKQSKTNLKMRTNLRMRIRAIRRTTRRTLISLRLRSNLRFKQTSNLKI